MNFSAYQSLYCRIFGKTEDCCIEGREDSRPVCDTPELLTRESPVHLTASALVFNRARTKVLFLRHLIYHAFTWPGGHSDGEEDPLAVAVNELREETGLERFTLFSICPVGLHILPVKAHLRRGESVAAHSHLNVTFAFFADENAPLVVREGENSAFAWLEREALEQACEEPHMLPVYQTCLRNSDTLAAWKERDFSALPKRLIPWFAENQRDLPWRHGHSAYRTWVSEIMLQQTRVEAGKTYFERFVGELPDVYALAACPEDKLMKLWEGLGYYNRARNLQKAARLIVEKYHGAFPDTAEALQTLPGIGAYTAGAIASIAFDRAEPAVDGNVMRVIARVTEDYRGMDDAAFKKELFDRLKTVYPRQGCGDFTQSLMELGAIVCLPNGRPLCERCPMQACCMAHRLGAEESLPVPKQKPVRAKQALTVVVFVTRRGISLQKRSEKGVLHGLWEFPNWPGERPLQDILQSLSIVHYRAGKHYTHTHVFTHLEWDMTCYFVETDEYAGECHPLEEIVTSCSVPSAFRWILKGVAGAFAPRK